MTLIDPFLLKTQLTHLAPRFNVEALAECDSTNSEMLRRAALGAPAGTVIVADRQQAGRGRRGRPWLSSPQGSLTFSLLWRFPTPALAGLSLAVGLGLARALQQLGAQGIRLKWPNDVLLEREGECAKLAGTLIELASDRRGMQAVIGIGLNLTLPAETLPQPVAGLAQACAMPPERHVVLAALLVELAGVLDRFAVDGFAGLKSEWQALHAWQDREVVVLDEAAPPLRGLCRGVDDEGALLLAGESGLHRVLAGDVSLRPA